ncbi:septin-2-like protein 1 [Sarcoptes scabiei]|uniref:Septin-2-like protein 1 n=1 Tax=Sarcoptes scabiei TaxID=52283 RepID=A0A132AGU7_SARSC|nr:septin-2-like protein 1 [Sarcoptes scabiei]
MSSIDRELDSSSSSPPPPLPSLGGTVGAGTNVLATATKPTISLNKPSLTPASKMSSAAHPSSTASASTAATITAKLVNKQNSLNGGQSSVNQNGTTQNGANQVNPNNGIRVHRPETYVGFDTLPDQFVSRVIRDGFGFNILALGSTGVGKTTLLEALFNTKLQSEQAIRSHNSNNVTVSTQQIELNEGSIKLKLSLIESKGFGDQINKTESYKPIVEYIDAQFEKYLQEELKIHRSQSPLSDTRIHCCLYILSPVGHGLRALDLVTMKSLHTKVNLIPVIGKADTITKSELEKLRSRITNELNANGIEYYRFPVDDPDVADINTTNNALTPFAVVASNDFIRIGSKHIRARQYPWGTVHIENENHCDFVRLRDMVIRVNMEDLRDTTHSKHYELYRRVRLQQMGFGSEDNEMNGHGDGQSYGHSTSFKETFEWRRQAHLESLQRREEDMRTAFVQRVKEKEQELKEKERDLHTRFERSKREDIEEKKRLELEKNLLEEEIKSFNARKTAVLSNSTLVHPGAKLIDKAKKK